VNGAEAHNPAKKVLTGRLSEVALAYQRVLAAHPSHPEALIGMSLVALASRQTEAAVRMAAAGAAAAPGMVTAWVALGQALKAAGQQDHAEQAYALALRLDGASALAHLGLGELRLASERAEEAAAEFELALRREPGLAGAHLGHGNALAMMERDAEALARYEQALTLHPRLPEAEFAAGFALARMGRAAEAETRYRRAIASRPDFAAAWMNLGNLLREQGREAYAETALRRATALRPDAISGWINLAVLERERGNAAQAEKHLRTAFDLNPGQVETLIAWCQFCARQCDNPGAWAWLERALAVDPAQDEAVNMKGILLHTEGRFAEAVRAFEQAEALGNRTAPSNRGNSLLELGRMDEALRAHRLAVERDPSHAGAAYNLALTQLRLGDWEHGWPAYEARWRFREVHRVPRTFRQPRWRGEPLHGRPGAGRVPGAGRATSEERMMGQRVLLHAEQGLGDTIQFCRYAELVAARGGFPILQVQEPVERLLRSLEVVRTGRAETAVLGGAPVEFALECPLMSLPAVFGATVNTVPWSGAYLHADAELVREKQAAFASRNPGPRIGIAWAGNPRYKADRQRSMRLETLLPLLRAHHAANWISLQKGEAPNQIAGEIATLAADVTGPDGVTVLDGSGADRDLAETAALIATLDLVITTDTCIAHLAGAMNRPVWIMLPHLADWRWMEQIETTPWYPAARLFRQTRPGDWSEVLERVAAELQRLPVGHALHVR
jgi:tetratricopeptide (TPR) repeat protein